MVAALPLTACADADTPDGSSDPAATDASTDIDTDAPADEDADADAPAGDPGSEVADPVDMADEPTADVPAPTDQDPAESTPATAALFFDGRQVPIAEACNGADGAVIATTQGEVTIQAILEDPEPAMRYMAEGEELYIEDVTTSEMGITTVYEGTFEPAGSEPLDVRFEVGDTSDLDDCS